MQEDYIIDVQRIFKSLENRDGVYFSKKTASVSYPEYGNDIFYRVEDESFWFSHRNNCIIEIVRKFCGSGAVFFDVGGGNGFVSKGLQDAGFEPVLIEPGINGVMNAKKRGVKKIICSAIQDIELDGQLLESAGLFDVLEHVEDDSGLLSAICSRMAENGHIFITVPAYRFLWSDEDVEAGHFKRYTLKSLAEKLETAGFEIVYGTYFFGFLLLPILLMRTLPFNLGFSRRRRKDLAERFREHKAPHPVMEKIIELLLASELKSVRALKKMLFGGSCLIAAKKKKIEK